MICTGIIFGGRSSEHAVSLMAPRPLLSVLSPEKTEFTWLGQGQPPSSIASVALRQVTGRIYKVVDCGSTPRVDFLAGLNDNSIYVSDVDCIPGFTQNSMNPKLWETSGPSHPAFNDCLGKLALERGQDRHRTMCGFGGKA